MTQSLCGVKVQDLSPGFSPGFPASFQMSKICTLIGDLKLLLGGL